VRLHPPTAATPEAERWPGSVALGGGVIGSRATQADEEFRAHLPRLLHVSFLNFDNRNDLVYEQARLLVINLVHSLVAKHAGQTETYDRATAIIAQLTAKESTWGPPRAPRRTVSRDGGRPKP